MSAEPAVSVWSTPRAASQPPRPSARSTAVRLGGAILALLGVGAVAYALTLRLGGIDSSALARYRPAPLATPAPSATPLPLDVVANRALPSVVTIQVETSQGEEFGTGWLLDRGGDFVTNYHVIARRNSLRILDNRNAVHDATVMGFSIPEDVAVIRSADGFRGDPLTAASASDPPVPEAVIVLASSRATGQPDRTLETLDRLHQPVPVQADTDVNPAEGGEIVYSDMMVLRDHRIFRGNSGGPVLDAYGHVVGVVTLASQSTPQAFAIPIGRVIDELLAFAARPVPQG
jgi:putative serine protease PepD